MDIQTVITTLVSSGVISIGAARWMAGRLVDQRLAKDLKYYQAELDEKLAAGKAQFDKDLAMAKAELDATLKLEVDEYLADRAAERQYRLDARKRLYAVVGPLRFQLVIACIDFASRIKRIGNGQQPYATSLKDYFGQSTTFRLLRLFAISELIERQVAHADFAVDPSMVNLLRFKKDAFLCLSSSTVSLDHPKANWNHQVEHVYYDTISIIAGALIVNDSVSKMQRVISFDEFSQFVSVPETLARLNPIPGMMETFSIQTKPIFWVRLVALAHLCSIFAANEGPHVGITPEEYDSSNMLHASSDEFLTANHDRYCTLFRNFSSVIYRPHQKAATKPGAANPTVERTETANSAVPPLTV
jgi:hypothetical protein